jgi:hypothetical protein
LTPLQVVLGLVNNSISRKNELEADTFQIWLHIHSMSPLITHTRH